jgi:hypothetical protein
MCGRDEGAKMWRQFGARIASMAGPSRDDKLDRNDAARICRESCVGDMIETWLVLGGEFHGSKLVQMKFVRNCISSN